MENKYVRIFKEAVKKLEEENAATRYFKDYGIHSNPEYFDQENIISTATDIFGDLMAYENEFKYFEKTPEYKTNSQATKIYNIVKKMIALLPQNYTFNAYENDSGNKDNF